MSFEPGPGVDAVCAVVVSYFPDEAVIENLAWLRRQVGRIVVIDNGSSEVSLAKLRMASGPDSFELIENLENLGIATALNQGVRWARAAGGGSVLLFDQDSTVTEGYVAAMLACLIDRQRTSQVGILVPRYVDGRLGTVLPPPLATQGTWLEAATTSGSLMPLEIFDAAGFFAEELFIDGVDYEYSLRIRRLGFLIAECPEATLLHEPGTPTVHRLLGSKAFSVANYSPIRRYYQERNKIWVTRRYWRDFFRFCVGQFVISAKDLLKILLIETDKRAKCTAFFAGVLDGLRGRTGKR